MGAEIQPSSEKQMIRQGSRGASWSGEVRGACEEFLSLFNQEILGLAGERRIFS